MMARRSAVLLLPLLLGAGPRPAADTVDLPLRPEASVSGPWVRVADVADLDAVRRLDVALADRLASVRLAPVRANAGTLLLPVRDIATAVRHAAPGRIGKVTLDGAKSVRVTAQLRPLPAAQLRSAASEQFLRRCAEVAERCTATIDAGAVSSLDIPAGRWRLDAALPPRWLDRPDTVDVKLRVIVDDVVVAGVRVPVHWRAVRTAWVVEAPTDPRVALRRRDVRPVRVDAAAVAHDAIAFEPASRLLHTTAALDRGTILVPPLSMLATFRAGDEVPLTMSLGNVRVTRNGTAVQDGRPGARAFVRVDQGQLLSGAVPMPADGDDAGTEKQP